MLRRLSFLFFALASFCFSQAQKKDTAANDIFHDASINYDELFNELDDFLDSLLKPRSYTLINLQAGSNIFNYTNSNTSLKSSRQLALSPSVSHYNKNGFGISASANIVREKNNFNPYQFAATLSYDFLQNMNFVGGLSATRYFTKDSLAFYTSPLKNEIGAYFSYRKLWLKPSLSASYGWGNRTEYSERTEYITILRKKRTNIIPVGTTTTNTEESISDFNLTLSVRHDFYWLDVFSSKDFIRFTPQVSFTGGTQNFGFNQTSNTYGPQKSVRNNLLYESQNVNLNDQYDFKPLSVTAYLKSEFSTGRFFLQPQLGLNYYIPASADNLTTIFSVNTGFLF